MLHCFQHGDLEVVSPHDLLMAAGASFVALMHSMRTRLQVEPPPHPSRPIRRNQVPRASPLPIPRSATAGSAAFGGPDLVSRRTRYEQVSVAEQACGRSGLSERLSLGAFLRDCWVRHAFVRTWRQLRGHDREQPRDPEHGDQGNATVRAGHGRFRQSGHPAGRHNAGEPTAYLVGHGLRPFRTVDHAGREQHEQLGPGAGPVSGAEQDADDRNRRQIGTPLRLRVRSSLIKPPSATVCPC